MGRRLRYLIAFVFMVCVSAAHASAGDIALTILFTGDHHEQVLPLKEPSKGNIAGGVARRHTLIQELRREAGADRVILVDAGDLFYGTAKSGASRVDIDCAAYQLMGYDAVSIGNHDFDYGRETLQKCIHTYSMPWVSATLIDIETQRHYLKPYVVKTIEGIRIGIIGLTSPAAFKRKERKNARGLQIAEPAAALQELRAGLEQNADIFIAITHQGFEADRAFARDFPFLHVIIGGHDHRAMGQALAEKNTESGLAGPIIAHAGHRGMYLGRLDITVSGDREQGYRVTHYGYRLIPVTADIAESAEMLRFIKRSGVKE